MAVLMALCALALVMPRSAHAVPAAPVLEAPADAATGVSLTPTLTWKAAEGAKVYQVQGESMTEWRVLIWNLAVTEKSVVVGPLTPDTKYHWRVRAANNEGYGPWSDVRWFKTGTEAPELAAPVLHSPANASSGILQPARLKWLSVLGAKGYSVVVSTSAEFGTVVVDAHLAGTVVEVTGLARNTKYYWKVRATDGERVGPWSHTWYFTTADAEAPGAPTLVFPNNGRMSTALRPEHSWSSVPNATAYVIQVATDSAFSKLVWSLTVYNGATSAQSPLLAKSTKHYWRVRAKSAAGAGPWSSVWWFYTVAGDPPAAPVLHSPANGAGAVSLPPTLTWLPATGANGYRVQVSTSQSFVPLVWSRELSGTSTSVPELAAGVKYYWRVQGKNAAGWGAFSATWYFVTGGQTRPAAPVLHSPANGATGLPTNLPLLWLAAARATGYFVQVSLTPDFSRVVWSQGVAGGVTGAEPLGLALNTTYYWRVKASNNVGHSDWSSVWHFTTKSETPPGS